jgi:hypothetical protein
VNNVLIVKGLAAVLSLAVFVLGSCNAVGNIPGNVAGQLVNEAGQGQGFIAVQLIDVATGQLMFSENANDTGNFMFKGVDPAEYKIVAMPIGGGEIPSDAKPFKLAPGKTVTITVTLYRDQVPASE